MSKAKGNIFNIKNEKEQRKRASVSKMNSIEIEKAKETEKRRRSGLGNEMVALEGDSDDSACLEEILSVAYALQTSI